MKCFNFLHVIPMGAIYREKPSLCTLTTVLKANLSFSLQPSPSPPPHSSLPTTQLLSFGGDQALARGQEGGSEVSEVMAGSGPIMHHSFRLYSAIVVAFW